MDPKMLMDMHRLIRKARGEATAQRMFNTGSRQADTLDEYSDALEKILSKYNQPLPVRRAGEGIGGWRVSSHYIGLTHCIQLTPTLSMHMP